MKTLDEFKEKYKSNGGFKKAAYDIKQMIGLQKDSLKNWNGLFYLYDKHNNTQKNDNFFISEDAKLIFALTQLDGEKRAEILGITKEMYSSLEKSKKWYRSYISKLHPDRCKHPLADEAIAQLNNIYERMKKYGE